MLCVTHEMGFAQQVADRIVFMDGRRLSTTRTPKRIFSGAQVIVLKEFLKMIL